MNIAGLAMNILCLIAFVLAPIAESTAQGPGVPVAEDETIVIVVEDTHPKQLRRVRRWWPKPLGPPGPLWEPPFDAAPFAETGGRNRGGVRGPGFGGGFGAGRRRRRQRFGLGVPPLPGFDGPGFPPEFGGPRRRRPGHRHRHGPRRPPHRVHPGGRPFRGPGPHIPHGNFGGPHTPHGDPQGYPDYQPEEGEGSQSFNSLIQTEDHHSESNSHAFSFQDTTQGQQQPTTAKPVLKFQSSCGISTTSRIVGGEQVQRDDWSWTVALMRPARNGVEQFCGATLISQQHMITAAHCVVNMQPGSVKARIGYTKLDDADASKDLEIEYAIIHPAYNSTNYYADIAVIKLQQPVQFSTRLQPCCLPEARENAGRDAIAVGWGSTAFGGPQTNVLQQVTLPIWDNMECQNKINILVHDVQLCAGRKDTGGHDACQGDSGGPLLLRNSDERWSLEGIISFGFKCAQKGVPGVYTRVSKFVDWIINNAV